MSFFALGSGAVLAWNAQKQNRRQGRRAAARGAPEAEAAALAAAEKRRRLSRRRLKTELGCALLPLVNGPDGTDRLTEQINVRKSLAGRDGL